VTLILAIRFKTGVLLASDSQATMDTAGQPTKQEAEKLYVLGGQVGWGASGSQGLIQRVRHELESHVPEIRHGFVKDGTEQGARKVFGLVNPIQQQAVKEHVQPFSREPQSVAALFVGYSKGQPFILEIAREGTRQFHDAPYAAIGSGDVFAIHAIRSVAHYKVEELAQDSALALAFRTVDSAIKTAAFGLGGEVQLLVVTAEGARCLSRAELRPIEDLIDIWKGKEVETLGSLSPEPKPPPGPSPVEPPKE